MPRLYRVGVRDECVAREKAKKHGQIKGYTNSGTSSGGHDAILFLRDKPAKVLQPGLHALRLVQHAGEQIAHAIEAAEHVGDVKLLRLESRPHLVPGERCGHRRAPG